MSTNNQNQKPNSPENQKPDEKNKSGAPGQNQNQPNADPKKEAQK